MRLTTNENGLYVDNNCIVPQSNDIITKLGQLEDIEEELGIDLVTLFKALKNGIWYKSGREYYHAIMDFSLVSKCFREYIPYGKTYIRFYLKDYGKTWALTKEELEHESDTN